MIDHLTAPVLPDSRLSTPFTPKGAKIGPLGWMVPIYCANCGVSGGDVPQENCDFAFWLCTTCYEKYGHVTPFMVTPDEVFWEQVKQEQIARYGRELSTPELIAVVDADVSPLATLIRQGHR